MIFQTYFVSKFFGIGDVWIIFKQNTFQIKSHIKTFLYLVGQGFKLKQFWFIIRTFSVLKTPKTWVDVTCKNVDKLPNWFIHAYCKSNRYYNIELIVSPTKFSIVCSWTNLTWSWKFIFRWTRNTYGIWGLGIIVPE